MTEPIPMEILDAIREAMEETARRFAQDKSAPASQPPAAKEARAPEQAPTPGTRPHWRFI